MRVPVRAARSPTPCTTPAASTRMLLPVPDGTAHPLTEELLTYDVDVSWWVRHAVEPAQPPAQALPVRGRDPDAPALRPRIDIAATVYPTSGRRRDGGVESSAGLSASTSSSMKNH